MKVDRHAKIVELIGKYEIETQEELAEYLTKAGYQVTQATVSRDIRELKLSKVQAESGKQRYVVFQSQEGLSDKYIRILRDGFSFHGYGPEYSGDQDGVRHAMRAAHWMPLPGDRGLYRGRRYHHVRSTRRG